MMDIYPTVLSVAGVKVPENHILDGSTLERMIAGKKDKAHRDDFLIAFPSRTSWQLFYFIPQRRLEADLLL